MNRKRKVKGARKGENTLETYQFNLQTIQSIDRSGLSRLYQKGEEQIRKTKPSKFSNEVRNTIIRFYVDVRGDIGAGSWKVFHSQHPNIAM